MLQCQNVMKTYGSKVAVSNITTSIEPGKIYALLGSNGSGKTTFMKMVAGLVKPTSGTITFCGQPIGVESKKHIAYMPTESFYYNYMSCKDAGNFYKDFYEDFDENKYYFIIKAIPGEMVIDDDTYEWFGSFLLNRKEGVLYDYLNKEKAKRDTILSAISPENNATRYKEVLKELEIIQKGIDMYEG